MISKACLRLPAQPPGDHGTMAEPQHNRYVCIHGHFYQPPRENPWLDEIEKEDSAAPCHDWNERINLECYRANAAARLVDDRNRILLLHNNYKSLSFNFGPTLLRWLERNDPWVYRALLQSDRDSCMRMNGHGNAVAQAYNHIIMPLANRRDKTTQVLWGIRDFEHRFKRRPEGMWLPETAVDRETLCIMADAGIRYTILSPEQAARWRFLTPGSPWQDVRGGRIPTGRAYRCDCGGGLAIHIFFYDPSLARGIAFEGLLEHSTRLTAHIDSLFARQDRTDPEPWLVNTATDGESYGHHFKFGDMALAAAFHRLEQDPATTVINYAAFLDAFPVKAEVDIIENTAWSCSHGLGRWEKNCGCRLGESSGWTQQWRAPLRQALNLLRDILAVHFERQGERLCPDPWKARDEYIQVLLDPEHRMEEFLENHMWETSRTSDIHRFLRLLEMQRFAVYMFTSCGWFFDEISGLETQLILRYAARAIQLAEHTGAESPEPAFLEVLGNAASNLPQHADGARVYSTLIKPQVVEKSRVVASYAIQSLAMSTRRRFSIYGYGIDPLREADLGANPSPCLLGHVRVRSGRTLVEEDYLYAAIHFGGLDFRCSVKPLDSEKEYDHLLVSLQNAAEQQNTLKFIRILDELFGPSSFGLHDVLRDLRTSVALEISRKILTTYTDLQRHLFQIHRPLMSSLRQWNIRIPSDLRVSLRRILTDDLRQLLMDIITHERMREVERGFWDATDFHYRAHVGRLHSLLDEARFWGITLQLEQAAGSLGGELAGSLAQLRRSFDERDAGRLYRLLQVSQVMGIVPELWKVQTLYFELMDTVRNNPGVLKAISNPERFFGKLDEILGCRFSLLIEDVLSALSKDIVPFSGTRALLRLP